MPRARGPVSAISAVSAVSVVNAVSAVSVVSAVTAVSVVLKLYFRQLSGASSRFTFYI